MIVPGFLLHSPVFYFYSFRDCWIYLRTILRLKHFQAKHSEVQPEHDRHLGRRTIFHVSFRISVVEVAALSGGMKRKLSVACTFLGEPKSVLQTADFLLVPSGVQRSSKLMFEEEAEELAI